MSTTTIISSIVKQASSVAPAHERPTSPAQGGWASPDSVLTKLFSGDPSTIALAFLVTLSLPALLHFYLYRQAARSRGSGANGIRTCVLLGPSGSGKTSLITLLQRNIAVSAPDTDLPDAEDAGNEGPATNGNGHVGPSLTRMSQVATAMNLKLPPGIPLGSNTYRSENDFEVTASRYNSTPYRLIDTPGHGKLRLEHALSHLSKPDTDLRAVIFMLDSAAIDAETGEASKDTVRYLHDVLLQLQRRPRLVKKAKGEDVQVLIACNKQDLFTALPPGAVRDKLQDELELTRSSKKRGLTAVDAKEDEDVDEDDTILGGGGERSFTFKLLEDEFGINVEVVGGAVKGDDDGKAVRKWEEWIGSCL